MNKYFNIIFISSAAGSTKQIQIRKSWVLALLSISVIASGIGYFWVFSQSLSERPTETQYRKQISRKNLQLTKELLLIEATEKKVANELSILKKEASKTMEVNYYSPNISSIDANSAHINFQNEGPKKQKTVQDLFMKLGSLQSYYDNRLNLLQQNQEAMDNLPTLLPVSRSAFLIRGFGKVLDPFSGKLSYHTGLDLSGFPGDPVYAPGDGRVTSITRETFYGKTIRITHSNQTMTFFAHLHSIDVKKGSKVRRGQIIGTIGSSGKSTGPHLHYEVTVNGEKIDPADLYLFELESPFLAQAD